MAHWGFLPQETLEETISADVQMAAVTPLIDIVEPPNSALIRSFRLRYSVVTSEDAAAMATFFSARRGPWESFTFTSPNDMRTYDVRFDTSMRLEFFQPQFFRSGGEIPLIVLGPPAPTPALGVVEDFATLDSPLNFPNWMVFANGQLFVVTYDSPCTVIRFNTPLSNLSSFDTVTLGTDYGINIIYAPSKAKLYVNFGIDSPTGFFPVREIDPVTLSDTLRINSVVSTSVGGIDTDDTYIYATLPIPGPTASQIRRYRLSDYGLDQQANVSASFQALDSAINVSGGKCFINSNELPGRVARFDAATLVEEQNVALASDMDAPSSPMAIVGGNFFQPNNTSDLAMLPSTDLAATLTRIPLGPTGNGQIGAAAFNGMVYVTLLTVPPALVRVHPTTFATRRMDCAAVPGAGLGIATVGGGGFLFLVSLGTFGGPAKVIRIRETS